MPNNAQKRAVCVWYKESSYCHAMFNELVSVTFSLSLCQGSIVNDLTRPIGIERNEKKMELVTFHHQLYDRTQIIYTPESTFSLGFPVDNCWKNTTIMPSVSDRSVPHGYYF